MLRELLNLPAVERFRLADRLYSSLSEEDQDDALEAELDRRWKEVASRMV
ncbi:MAG: addiction module protein [Planctomycetia bacterium]|nr:addiction module protein [Planctomycetia bacterium]